MSDDIEDIFEGWLERPTDDQEKNKGWLKKSFAKKWKKGYYVLRKFSSTEQAFLQWFDKEEHWRRQMPKGTLELFPKYKVLKKPEFKGKQYVFEVSNDCEMCMLAADSESVMDLWAIQLQMQTRLNPRVAGRMFRVKGKSDRQMQRIGAKDQYCLLHISKWGVTLALERSRAVLAQWPLTTIRTYESLDCSEFSFEAGRASPMGQGKYTFVTQPGEDNQIFDTIDGFASFRLAGPNGHSTSAGLTDEDLARAYDELRFSIQVPAVGDRGAFMWSADQSAPRSIDSRGQQGYDHIERSDSIGSARSFGSVSASLNSSFNYNHIERHPSWGSQSMGRETCTYDKLNLSVTSMGEGNYDRLERSPSARSHKAFSPPSIGAARCPLELPSASRQRLVENMSPVSPDSELGIVAPFDNLLDSAAFDEDENSEWSLPPALPPRTKGKKSADHEYDRLKEQPCSEPRRMSEASSLVATVGSPNFRYLNTAYSSSIEVLPALYATVDKSKKSKGKQRGAGQELAKGPEDGGLPIAHHGRTRSKSYESVCGSPKFTHFTAFSSTAVKSTEEATGDLACSPDSGLVSPRTPQSERVALAIRSSVSEQTSSVESRGELKEVNHGGTSPSLDVSTLERTVSQLPHPNNFSKVGVSSA